MLGMTRHSPEPFQRQGRLRAVLLCLAALSPLATLSACSSQGASPIAQSLRMVLPDIDGTALAKQAAALPYASLSVNINGNRGLVVLGTQANATTYWQSNDNVTLALTHGGLTSTGGFKKDLLSTEYRPLDNTTSTLDDDYVPWLRDAPAHYRLERSWKDGQDMTIHDGATGRMHCESASAVRLPLQTRRLERCTLVHTWHTGETTTDIIWRDPADLRVWAGRMVPWPGHRVLSWQVAKPWWPPAPQQATGGSS